MKRALISVFDKTGVVEFSRGLVGLGYEIVSTGGTLKTLHEENIPVTYVSDLTGFPEILDGRVKTLHPVIHGGILAKDTPAHNEQLKSIGAAAVDLVAVNLYPFEKVATAGDASFADILENIDIGGPTLLRAAAKNHPRVYVVSDPASYDAVLEHLSDAQDSPSLRRELAAKAFAHTAYYDSLIARYLGEPAFNETLTLPLRKAADLRYGENPHQRAAYYNDAPGTQGLAAAEQLHGKPLSFNNVLDLNAACQMAAAFEETCVVAVKHGNPCGLGIGSTIEEAYQKAYDGDRVSIFGGIVAANTRVDSAAAALMNQIFLEIVVAPDFTDEALEVLRKKTNLRIMRLKPQVDRGWDWRRVQGGWLVQEADVTGDESMDLRVVTQKQPSEDEMQDLLFAWRIVKHVKSNAIVLAKDKQLIGVGAGQMNRVQSVKLSIEQAGERAAKCVLASDAFFPFADNIDAAAAAGIAAIIEPGGSLRDQEVIDACDRYGIAMVFTGVRHFRH